MTNKWLEREWWATLIPAVIGLLTVLGVIGPNDNTLVSAVTGVVLIVGPAMAFIVARIWAKVAIDRTAATLKIETLRAKLEKPPAA